MTSSIKICGITSVDDARMISETGIDYLGVLVNVRQSPRSIGIEKASEIIAASKVPVIVLTYDHAIDEVLLLVKTLHPAGLQLAGSESETYIASLRDSIDVELWKSLHLASAEVGTDSADEAAALINRLERVGINRVVLDTAVRKGSIEMRGGTGERCDWSAAARIKRDVDMFIFLAGGINPENVGDALLQVRPDGVDLSSGVERSVGKKDAALVASIVSQTKATAHKTP